MISRDVGQCCKEAPHNKNENILAMHEMEKNMDVHVILSQLNDVAAGTEHKMDEVNTLQLGSLSLCCFVFMLLCLENATTM